MFSLPINQMPRVTPENLFPEIHKRNYLSSIIFYVIDSKYRTSVKLVDWYNREATKGVVLPVFDGTQKAKCLQALAWVRNTVRYAGDPESWGATEKWQTLQETLARRQGDCEDGALLLMEVLRRNGIPDYQLYLVAGDVVGGGHAYVVWRSDEDVLEYTLDWCYWSRQSLVQPYESNKNYYYGDKEWFRFNWTGSYVKRKR